MSGELRDEMSKAYVVVTFGFMEFVFSDTWEERGMRGGYWDMID